MVLEIVIGSGVSHRVYYHSLLACVFYVRFC